MSVTSPPVDTASDRGSGRRGAQGAVLGAPANGSAELGPDQEQQTQGSNGHGGTSMAAASTSETNGKDTPMDSPQDASAADAAAPELPKHLMPSRVQQNRIQIGPRLRPTAHARFVDYSHELSKLGVTQSDVVESALLEYMDRYPTEVLRAALLEGH